MVKIVIVVVRAYVCVCVRACVVFSQLLLYILLRFRFGMFLFVCCVVLHGFPLELDYGTRAGGAR